MLRSSRRRVDREDRDERDEDEKEDDVESESLSVSESSELDTLPRVSPDTPG